MSDTSVVVTKITSGKRFVSARKIWAEVSTDHTVTDEDEIIVTSTAAARNITLPLLSAGPLGKTLSVVDGSGAAGTNNITVTAAGSNTINAAATAVIASNYGTLTIVPTLADGWVTEVAASGGGAPSGSASGDLGGTYPSPTVAAIHETSGPTKLTIGAIADTKLVKRSGSTLVAAVGGTDYVAPGGVATGQTINGGAAASETLNLVSTAHATKGSTTLGAGSAAQIELDEPNNAAWFGKRSLLAANATSRFAGDPGATGQDYFHLLTGKTGVGMRPSMFLGNRGASGGDDVEILFGPAGTGFSLTGTAFKAKYDVASTSYRFYLSPGNASNVASDVVIVDGRFNVALGKPSAATNATDGFVYMPSCAGTPTGVPTTFVSGLIPTIVDSTNFKHYMYAGGAWKGSAAYT